MQKKIYLGFGGNLTVEGFASPRDLCEAAIARLADNNTKIIAVSPWYRTAPVPISDQPWFYNAVVEIATNLTPPDLIAVLHHLEADFGRIRIERNEARPLDIDIIDYAGRVMDGNLTLPHPRLHERAFVLYPLYDLAPDWVHPVSGVAISALISGLSGDQNIMKDET